MDTQQTPGQPLAAGKIIVETQFRLPNICTAQSLLFAVLAGSLLSIMFSLVGSGLSHFNWEQFSLISFFVLWIVLVNMALLCQLRSYLMRLDLLQGVVLSYSAILITTLIISLMAQWFLVSVMGRQEEDSFSTTVEHVLIAGILAGVSLRYLYLQEQLHIQQQAELASRIQALQSRIRPHFLFNSMNIIASLIESDPELAERVVEDLSELFRATLSDASQLVPLNQEVELAKSYVHIESLRLGERLQVDWQVDVFDDDVVIPHLSLQPLLENAIYHGIQPLPEGGTVDVSIRKDGDKIHVQIRNPIPIPDVAQAVPHRGNSLALENFHHRLQAYYGQQAVFFAGQRVSGTGERYFEVNFSCPV